MATGGSQKSQQVAYNGMWDAFKRTVREEGFLSLYRGIGTNIIKVRA